MDVPYKNWTVNLEDKTTTDDKGLVVKFHEPSPGTLEGEIQNPDELENLNDATPIIQDAARAFLGEMKKAREEQGTENNGAS